MACPVGSAAVQRTAPVGELPPPRRPVSASPGVLLAGTLRAFLPRRRGCAWKRCGRQPGNPVALGLRSTRHPEPTIRLPANCLTPPPRQTRNQTSQCLSPLIQGPTWPWSSSTARAIRSSGQPTLFGSDPGKRSAIVLRQTSVPLGPRHTNLCPSSSRAGIDDRRRARRSDPGPCSPSGRRRRPVVGVGQDTHSVAQVAADLEAGWGASHRLLQQVDRPV